MKWWQRTTRNQKLKGTSSFRLYLKHVLILTSQALVTQSIFSCGDDEVLKISSGKQLFIPQRKTVLKEDNVTDIEIDVPGKPISDNTPEVLDER